MAKGLHQLSRPVQRADALGKHHASAFVSPEEGRCTMQRSMVPVALSALIVGRWPGSLQRSKILTCAVNSPSTGSSCMNKGTNPRSDQSPGPGECEGAARPWPSSRGPRNQSARVRRGCRPSPQSLFGRCYNRQRKHTRKDVPDGEHSSDQ